MQTVGYWCDECREKYVRHIAEETLPCGHDRRNALYVYAKSFGKRNFEHVYIARNGVCLVSVDIQYKPKEGVMYVGNGRELWAYQVTLKSGRRIFLGSYLREKTPEVIRAFLSRWESRKEPPFWREVELLTEEICKNMENALGEVQ